MSWLGPLTPPESEVAMLGAVTDVQPFRLSPTTTPTKASRHEPGERVGNMRDIVASIHPRHAQAILNGTKTVELRRKVWRMGAEIDRMFLYETAPTSALVGHVRVGVCRTMPPGELWDHLGARTGVTRDEFDGYFDGSDEAHGIGVFRPRRFSEPWSITDLGLKRPPQSWCYVPEVGS